MDYKLTNKYNKNLRIIPYNEESHNEKCQILEQNSGKLSFLCGIVQAERNLKISYSNMLTQKHQNGYILVVEDMDNQNLAAKACIGIKSIILNNQKEIACYIYDLRVDSSYQRLGIGWQLIQQIENYSMKNYNVTISYCTINEDNKRSQALFQKLGYNQQFCSERQIKGGFIDTQFINQGEKLYQKQLNTNVHGKLIKSKIEDEQEIIQKLSKYYKNIDFFPTKYSELIQHPKSMGFFQVKEEGTENYAGVHLFLEKQELSLVFKKIFCQTQDYDKFYVKASYTMILIILHILVFVMGLFNLLDYIFKEQNQSLTIFLICIFLMLLSFIICFNKLIKALKMIKQLPGPFIRLCGLMYIGDSQKKEFIVQQLLFYVSQIAITNNCGFLRYNIDRRSEFFDVLNSKNQPFFITKPQMISSVMPYKVLKENQEFNNYKLGKETFFDPRDV